jgi:nucleoside-diphosphate-sugar epimerase
LLHPEIKRDYIHIDDVASAIVLAARQPRIGTIDIASGVDRSTAALLASSPGVRNLPHPMKNLILDESASDVELSFLYSLGWSPRVTARYFSLVDSEGM